MRTKKEEKGRRKGEFEAVLAQGRLPQPLLCQIQYFPCVGLKHTQAISVLVWDVARSNPAPVLETSAAGFDQTKHTCGFRSNFSFLN